MSADALLRTLADVVREAARPCPAAAPHGCDRRRARPESAQAPRGRACVTRAPRVTFRRPSDPALTPSPFPR